MWRWPLNRSTAARLRACAALIPLLLIAAQTKAPAAPSHLGPVSESEAALLWKDGRADFEKKDFESAIPRLRRLIDRYPGYRGFQEAHRMLGISYLETDRAKEALPVLKAYAGSVTKPAEKASAKLLLARAYLRTNQPNEALLLSAEVARMPLGSHPRLTAEALLLKAQAAMAQGPSRENDRRAEDSIRAARKKAKGHETAELLGEAELTALELKLRACGRFPSAARLSEEQAIDQLGRRGTCLLETVPTFKAILDSGDPATSRLGGTRMVAGFESYVETCRVPPEPLEKRSPEQLKKYREELVRRLAGPCQGNLSTALEIVEESWSFDPKDLPEASAQRKRFSESLRRLTSSIAKGLAS